MVAEERFEPDDFWYDLIDGEFKGVARIREAMKAAGAQIADEIVTSRDPAIAAAQANLRGLKVPKGIDKVQLPVSFGTQRPVFFFITVGTPNAVVPKHVHKDEGIWRLIVSGSIELEGKELKQGDWVFVPKAKPYTYTVGPLGCVILHTYH